MTKHELQKIAAKISPSRFLSPTEFLLEVYKLLKTVVPQYSHSRFSEDLGFGAGTGLYLIIQGHRPLTLKAAQKIVSSLGLTGTHRKYFIQLVQAYRIEDPSEREGAFKRLVELKAKTLATTMDRFQLDFFNQWYNAAILELLALPDAKDDVHWLSMHLIPSVPPTKVEQSLKLLRRLGHVVRDDNLGRLVPSKSVMNTGPEVGGIAVMRYHQQMIALAKSALTDVAAADRDISAVTIAVSAKRLHEIKAKVQAFQQELLDMSATMTEADEVAQINIQVFPIGRINSRGKRNE